MKNNGTMDESSSFVNHLAMCEGSQASRQANKVDIKNCDQILENSSKSHIYISVYLSLPCENIAFSIILHRIQCSNC